MSAFSDKIEKLADTTNNISAIGRINELLKNIIPSGKSDFQLALSNFHNNLTKRKLVIVLTDFITDTEKELDSAIKLMRNIQAGRSNLIALHILDNAEINFNFNGVSQFVGMEGNEKVLIEPEKIRGKYIELFNKYMNRLKTEMTMSGIKYYILNTWQPLDKNLMQIFKD